MKYVGRCEESDNEAGGSKSSGNKTNLTTVYINQWFQNPNSKLVLLHRLLSQFYLNGRRKK